MKSSKTVITGWALSGLLAAFLCFASASGKFTDWEGKAEMFGHLGWEEGVMFTIGIVEVVIAMLFLIPRTAFVGAILLSAYLGGAVATHVRVGDPFFVPIIFGVIAWIALGLRDPRVFQIAFRSPSEPTPATSNQAPPLTTD
ncbi:DoxX family protein [Aporhodopirellula aestuarii]|uniref:DoxX family protein n=1 Tax=Aporhodopirellula aestuarii TaxID=2950107 RepID=A0ABT0U8J7_9BACT|nr:DoxX family protein [Aporhodopirellula aestuarii]MCM2372728.1 DoxX family protein [Aporhodopirellula aestuarii]